MLQGFSNWNCFELFIPRAVTFYFHTILFGLKEIISNFWFARFLLSAKTTGILFLVQLKTGKTLRLLMMLFSGTCACCPMYVSLSISVKSRPSPLAKTATTYLALCCWLQEVAYSFNFIYLCLILSLYSISFAMLTRTSRMLVKKTSFKSCSVRAFSPWFLNSYPPCNNNELKECEIYNSLRTGTSLPLCMNLQPLRVHAEHKPWVVL